METDSLDAINTIKACCSGMLWDRRLLLDGMTLVPGEPDAHRYQPLLL
jgi:hypothetical protein